MELPYEESYTQACIDKFDDVRARIDELQDEIKRLKKSMGTIAGVYLANAPTETDREALAYHVYWYVQEVNASVIERHTHGKTARAYAGPLYIDMYCETCKQIVNHAVPSRAQFPKSDTIRICDTCFTNREEYSNARRKAEQAERAATIHHLRTMPYSEYLKTDHWQGKRMAMLKRAKFRCQLCNSTGELHVHHRSYENRGDEPYSDLIVLCKTCHENHHSIGGGA